MTILSLVTSSVGQIPAFPWSLVRMQWSRRAQNSTHSMNCLHSLMHMADYGHATVRSGTKLSETSALRVIGCRWMTEPILSLFTVMSITCRCVLLPVLLCFLPQAGITRRNLCCFSNLFGSKARNLVRPSSCENSFTRKRRCGKASKCVEICLNFKFWYSCSLISPVKNIKTLLHFSLQ